MKIDSSISKTIAAPKGESKVVRNNSAKPQGATETGSRNEVQLTSSSQLQALGGSASTDQPVDTAKVEAIKQAISEGRFKINPEMIADRLLSSVKELLTSSKG